MLLLFKGTNQKLHILLLLTYHWPELRQMATPSSKENWEYSLSEKKLLLCVLKDSYQPLPRYFKNTVLH